ncbi:MAG: ABC transporter substrate-binding protein [Chloroflexota bacterium]
MNHNDNLVRISQEKLDYQKVAVIHASGDAHSESSYEVMTAALNDLGVEILTVETFESNETDFFDQLTRINDLKPDAVLVAALSAPAMEIVSQAHQLGIPNSVPLIVGVTLTQEQIKGANGAAEGAIFRSAWTMTAETPGNRNFIQKYRDEYGTDPSAFAALGYANIQILASAMAAAESLDSNGIRDALANISDLDTVLGQFSFAPVGDAVYLPIVQVVEDGKAKILQ